MKTEKWHFWVDRGGTFTDIVARSPEGNIHTHKLLSENPAHYQDAVLQGIRDVLGVAADQPVPAHQIETVRMGTTVATNALLEHTGEPLLLLVTEGFKDALRIAYQQRPDLFALDITLPQMLYAQVEEIPERIMATGDVRQALDEQVAQKILQRAYKQGLRAVAIVFMHGYRYQQHEQRLAQLAHDTGFTQVSTSHQSSPLIRYISRGDTTVIDAYLSPILRRYVKQVATELPGTELLFMQSNGGLTQAETFHGKDAILSGPAGGVVGMIRTAEAAGFKHLIGFDMGGTSTDVCHYQGKYERTLEAHIAGMRISAPMMRVHTVAAGGGSVLHWDQNRFQVGPDSAGADPGPVAYRAGGPLTITDCNVLLGKLQADFFPALFGEHADQPLDHATVMKRFRELAADTGQGVEEMAEGFLTVAVENMANAIKKISVQRGYDVTDYTLCSFGGAGGQHACLVADALGMRRIFLHEYSGVLSAYGMGLADVRKMFRQSVDLPLDEVNYPHIQQAMRQLLERLLYAVPEEQRPAPPYELIKTLHCHYAGSDSTLPVTSDDTVDQLIDAFTQQHQQRFGFADRDKTVRVSSIEIEWVIRSPLQAAGKSAPESSFFGEVAITNRLQPVTQRQVYLRGSWRRVPFYRVSMLPAKVSVRGPAILLETTGTIVVEPGWSACLHATTTAGRYVLLERHETLHYAKQSHIQGTQANPVMLEVFNNLYMSIAEQMGFVLEKTAVSVNIKERLDFSCAIFDPEGNLVANAPHMPVHLGSMSESIKAVIREGVDSLSAGDAVVSNDPYNGGTHLPDITVIRPVFRSEMGVADSAVAADANNDTIVFYVAARGHHADIGGITPGSIPPDSQTLDEEGVLIHPVKLMRAGVFQEAAIRKLLTSGPYPVRNIDYNLADLKAQLAACEKGAAELARVIHQYGLDVVEAYMRHVQDNAEESVRQVISALQDGEFCYAMDDGSQIQVAIRVDHATRSACIDFSGTSLQHSGNLNAPTAITRAAVLYVFRTLVADPVPLNEGCLKPLRIVIPEDCMLHPRYPAAVVAGNVETSQAIVDTLYGALQVMAAAQGTMNNVTWGNEQYQYYETLCGGAGATANADGADAVHTHMTNSRLTDPEILEQRFPVLLESFSIRQNSGGKGKHWGGCGVVRKLRFLQPMSVNILSGHRLVPPYGMAGGKPGKTGENWLIRRQGVKETLSFKDQTNVDTGDVLVIKTPGGGGYG